MTDICPYCGFPNPGAGSFEDCPDKPDNQEKVVSLILTSKEADELEQLLIDITYQGAVVGKHLMYDSRILFDVLSKLESITDNISNVQKS
jgi:hypothetical protein